MFGEIFLFELRSNLRKPSTYIFFFILFLLTLLLGLAAAGVFDTTRTDSNLLVNSAFVVSSVLLGASSSIFSILVSVLLISIMANAIQKDFQYNTHSLFFTKPISKSDYFFGRFLAVALIAIFVFSGLLLGYFVGNLFGIGKPMLGEFSLLNYFMPFVMFTVPNILFLGVLYFSLTTFLRTTMAAYIVAIILMVFQIISSTITQNIDNKELAAILEPSGSSALNLITEYWSPYERNTRSIPLTGTLLYNRLLWLGLSLLIGAFSYWRFSFSQFLEPRWFSKKNKEDRQSNETLRSSVSSLPAVTVDHSARAAWSQLRWLTLFEAKKIMRTPFFIIMSLLTIGLMLLLTKFMDMMYQATTYLVTYKMVENVAGSVAFFSVIFIIFHSGTIIWRERETKTDELVGATPVSNTVLFFSKLSGLTLAISLLFVIGVVAGICIQIAYGFYDIDLLQYLVEIVRNAAIQLVFIALCLSVQVYVPNKGLGFFVALIPIIVLPIIYGVLEWRADLIDFNSTGTGLPYSDMNGYGGTFIQWPFYRIYWFGFIGIFCLMALALYARGKEKSIRARWKLSADIRNKNFYRVTFLCMFISAATGSFIFYQTKVLQVSMKPKDTEKAMADMEKKYGRYRSMRQPRIISVSTEVDLFPKDQTLRMAATYVLQNKTQAPVDTLLINYNGGEKSPYHYSKLQPLVPFSLISDDQKYGIRLIRLTTPLKPGDSLAFVFDMTYTPRGLFDRINSPVVGNGTFINNNLMPSLGYDDQSELSENTARKEYGLPPKPRMARVDDSAARMNNYISQDADWIRFDATVSTDVGQTAIAPGYLQKEWVKDGRHYFQYKMDSPILNFYSVLSARYQIRRDKWKNVNIEIYYHEGHTYNIDRMIRSVKRSLDYYTSQFGPYQHRQLRIIEFPRYATFAQSFPNTIPYSESIGFITKVEEGPDKIDLPFFVTAHEVAHQWWAHQVIGGNVQGSVLMSETMSEYSALMVMEKEYGKESMRKFLKEEMDKYLMGRTLEGKGEMPLLLVENQQYIHYNKGSVIMYALQNYVGEKKLNTAIRAYLEKTRFSGPIYTNSLEFAEYLYSAVPDSLSYLFRDMFQEICLYENYVKELKYKKMPDNTYQVTLTVGSAKYYADNVGKLTAVPVNDYIDIGIFKKADDKGSSSERSVLLQRIRMDKPEKTFQFIVKEEPVSAGIDPYLLLIDRSPDNNKYKFSEKPSKPDL